MKTRHLIRPPLCALALFCAVFSYASITHAAILGSQNVYSISEYIPMNGIDWSVPFPFIAQNSGSAKSITNYVVAQYGGHSLIYVVADATGSPIRGGNNPPRGNCYIDSGNGGSTNIGFNSNTNTCSVISPMIAGNTYYLYISGGDSGTVWKIGSNGSVPFFNILDTTSGTGAGQDYWVEPYTPYNGAYASTIPETFEAQYYNSDGVYDTLGFQFTNLTGSTTPITTTTSVSSSGGITETNSVYLNPGDSYLWRPYAYSSTNSNLNPVYGNWYNFVASDTVPITINTAYNATLGTTTLPTTTNFLSFLNVPILLETKAPFAYIFQIADGIQQGLQSSATNPIPAGTFTWTGIGGATSTFDFFSTTTVGYYLSPTLIGLWRAFLVICLFVEFGFTLYNIARHQLHI